jgi:hypothetical protein
MGEKSTAALQDTPHGVLLVGGKIVAAEQFARHAGKAQMRAVKPAQAEIVEASICIRGRGVRLAQHLPKSAPGTGV